MHSKCTGLMGRIFGHKWVASVVVTYKVNGFVYQRHGMPRLTGIDGDDEYQCQRCGVVAGENK